jgi:hypothetical protein
MNCGFTPPVAYCPAFHQSGKEPPMFVHCVLFWCKEQTEETQQQMIDFAHDRMSKIPSVRQVYAGKSIASSREVVDSSYQLGLCVIFDDQAGHDAYQIHDIHQEFVKKFASAWTKVRVFDYA